MKTIENAQIIKVVGKDYLAIKNKKKYKCFLKGKFRQDNFKTTTPVVVGDFVDLLINEDDNLNDNSLITHIYKRENIIQRKSVNLSKQIHLLASNINYLLIFNTIIEPEFSSMFLDRIIIMAESSNITPVIIFNKIDILSIEEKEYQSHIISIYKNIGYKVFECSMLNNEIDENMMRLISNSTISLVGKSGTGKSSFIKNLDNSIKIGIKEISQYHKQGIHTTTFSEMYILEKNNVKIIDSPGIKGFGLVDIDKDRIFHFFREFKNFSNDCKFYNCTHTNEPKCGVKIAVENEQISYERYQNYLNIYHNYDESNYR